LSSGLICAVAPGCRALLCGFAEAVLFCVADAVWLFCSDLARSVLLWLLAVLLLVLVFQFAASGFGGCSFFPVFLCCRKRVLGGFFIEFL
jgi:hypothetical protein